MNTVILRRFKTMHLFSQVNAFLSQDPLDRKPFIDHIIKQNKPIDSFQRIHVLAKWTNTIRKVMNIAVMIFTFGFVKNIAGDALKKRDVILRADSLYTCVCDALNHEEPLLNQKPRLIKSPINTAAKLYSIITGPKTDFVRDLIKMITAPDFNLEKSTFKEVLSRCSEPEEKAEVESGLFVLKALCRCDVHTLKNTITSYSTEEQKLLIVYLLQSSNNPQNIVDLLNIIPALKDEVISSVPTKKLKELFLRTTLILEKPFVMNAINDEIKHRFLKGEISVLIPLLEISNFSSLYAQPTPFVNKQVYNRIIQILNEVNINETDTEAVLKESSGENIKLLYVASCLDLFPEWLQKVINQNFRKRYVNEIGLLVRKPLLYTQFQVFSKTSGLSSEEIFNHVSKKLQQLFCGNFSPEQLLKELKSSKEEVFLESLVGCAMKLRLRNDLIKYIHTAYKDYFIIKKSYQDILSAYDNKKTWDHFHTISGTQLPIHFNDYKNKKNLEHILQSYLSAMEALIEQGVKENNLKDALETGFNFANSCLDARMQQLNQFVGKELVDNDYTADFNPNKNLAVNLTEYLRVYMNECAELHVKTHSEKYKDVDFKSTTWKNKLRPIIQNKNEFWSKYITVSKFKKYLLTVIKITDKKLVLKNMVTSIKLSHVSLELQQFVEQNLLIKEPLAKH